jgi:hypothetical protein
MYSNVTLVEHICVAITVRYCAYVAAIACCIALTLGANTCATRECTQHKQQHTSLQCRQAYFTKVLVHVITYTSLYEFSTAEYLLSAAA